MTGGNKNGSMFLLYAPNSKSLGLNEPKFYLDIDQNQNLSTYNNNGKESIDFI